MCLPSKMFLSHEQLLVCMGTLRFSFSRGSDSIATSQAGKGKKKKKGKRKPQKARLADQQVNNDSNSTKPVETLTQSQQRVLAKVHHSLATVGWGVCKS